VAITRRSFLAGLGSVSVGLLFRRRLDAVLESLERDLVDEPAVPDQPPSAAEVVVQPQVAFRAEGLVVAALVADSFVLENICIGGRPQFALNNAVPAGLFTPAAVNDTALRLDAAAAGTEIRFRVRYVGANPAGARFLAALIGRSSGSSDRSLVLPIDSGCAITA
jgi:hypothetical protein